MHKQAMALACLALACTARAEQSRFYVSASAGLNDFELSETFADALALPDSRIDVDERDRFVGLGAGFNLRPNFAVEINYQDLGEVALQAISTLPDLRVNSLVETRALGIDLLAQHPLNETFSVYAKVGLVHWDLDAQSVVRDAPSTTVTTEQGDEQGESARIGAGLRMQFADRYTLGLDYAHFDAGDALVRGTRLRTVGLSFLFHF
jgi:opacity protein-like surface antigen